MAARDISIIVWVNKDRVGLVRKSIDEMVSEKGRRLVTEARLRTTIAQWNSDALACAELMKSLDQMSIPRRALARTALQLGDRRRMLITELSSLRGDDHEAA
jgi:hypothetical protein